MDWNRGLSLSQGKSKLPNMFSCVFTTSILWTTSINHICDLHNSHCKKECLVFYWIMAWYPVTATILFWFSTKLVQEKKKARMPKKKNPSGKMREGACERFQGCFYSFPESPRQGGYSTLLPVPLIPYLSLHSLFLPFSVYLKLKALFSLWFSFHRMSKLKSHLRSFWPEVFKLHFVAELFVQMKFCTQNPIDKKSIQGKFL